MKRFFSLLLLLLIAVLGAVTVNADGEAFSVDITGDAVVSAGSTVTYQVAVNGIAVEGGLIGADITVTYDTGFFELVSVEGKAVSGWMMDSNTQTPGTIQLNPAESNGSATGAVTADGAIAYTVTLKVVQTPAADSAALTVTYASGNDVNLNPVENAALDSLTVSLEKKLTSPTGLTLSNGVASWGAVENADSYTVQLYKGDKAIGNAATVTATSYNFNTLIEQNLGGSYSFRVTASSNDAKYTASEAATSDSYNVTGELQTPTIAVTSDKVSGAFKYTITDPNPAGTVKDYILYVYEKDGTTYLAKYSVEAREGSVAISELEGVVAGKEYRFAVVASSATAENTATGNASSEESARSSGVVADAIKSLTVKDQPQLNYTEGDTLNLSDLTVTVTYAAGSKEEVAFKKFADYGIVVSPQNGADVLLSMNGKSLEITCGSIKAEGAPTLSVEASECPHGNTKVEREEPTCGADGVEKEICQLCSAVVSEKKIAKTGAHSYGEWIIDMEPTNIMSGARHKDCTVCGNRVIEAIPAGNGETTTDNGTDVTTEPSATTPDSTGSEPTVTTEPAVTTTDNGQTPVNPLGSLSDLSRIFVTVLIVIVVLIVLFIILAIWLESRRNRRRRSQARTARARNTRKTPQNGNRRPRA